MNSNDKKNVVTFDAKKKPSKKINGVMIGSVIILILSAIVFILVPALTGFRGSDVASPVVGSYKGQEVKYEQNSEFVNYLSQYAEQVRSSGYDTEQYMYSILNSAFNSTVIGLAIDDYVNESDYIVPEEAVNRTMRSYFTDENGNFSVKAYNEADKATVQQLFKEVEKQLRTERYFSDFLGMGASSYYGNAEYLYGAKLSSKEADFVAGLNAAKRQFQLVAISANDLPEDEYKVFAWSNPSIFERLDYSICSASTEEEIQEIANLIKNNQITFDDAVASMSTNAFDAADGKLDLYNYQIKENLLADPDDYDDFVALGVGDISTPVHTQQGYALFRRNSANKPADLTDPEVVDVISAYVRVYEKGYIEDFYLDRGRDFATIAARDGFETAADELGLEVVEPSAFPCNYGNDAILTSIPSSEYAQLSGAESDRNFLKTAFSMQVGEISEPLVLGDNIIVLKYKEAVPQDDAVTSSMTYMYPYYTATYAQTAMQDAIMSSDDVKNDVMSFYFKYFLGYDF